MAPTTRRHPEEPANAGVSKDALRLTVFERRVRSCRKGKQRRPAMSYAAGRVINDADSHIMESLDWLSSHADPAIRDRLIGMRLEAGGSGAEKAIARALERQKDAEA